MRGQNHQGKNCGTLTPNNNFVGKSDGWISKELDNLTPDELFDMSKSDYKCWCLDLKPRLAA